MGPIAVIGAIPAREQSLTEDALRQQHAVVVALASRLDPLLPVRFGTRMTPDRLEATIRPALGVLATALEHVRDHQQMTLRLFGAPSAAAIPVANRSGAAYLSERRAAARAIVPEAEPLRAAVDPFVSEERVQPGRGGVRATLFHLVRRQDVHAYRAAIGRAAVRMPVGSVSVTGPWPAFAFAPELLT